MLVPIGVLRGSASKALTSKAYLFTQNLSAMRSYGKLARSYAHYILHAYRYLYFGKKT